MNGFKLWALEQQEKYLRKHRIRTELRKYIFLQFEKSILYFFGDDEMAKEIIEELR